MQVTEPVEAPKATRKKAADQILEEIHQENERMFGMHQPATRKLMGDKEKERFARHMQFRGQKPPTLQVILILIINILHE